MDVFAGTGAFGLEALSRGARHVTFIEQERTALVALRANIIACRAAEMCTVLPIDALATPAGEAATLIFLDPPYARDMVARTMLRLRAAGRVAPGSLVIAETGREEAVQNVDALAERTHGAARITIWREQP